jgi:hypothetical protein
MVVSLKASDTDEGDQLFLRTLAAEKAFLFGQKKDLSAFPLGSVVGGKIARVEKFGVVVQLSDDVTGFATAEQAKGVEQKVRVSSLKSPLVTRIHSIIHLSHFVSSILMSLMMFLFARWALQCADWCWTQTARTA